MLELNYGNLQLRKGQYAAALTTFKRGVGQKHRNYVRLPSYLNSSVCLRELGEITTADEYLKRARALVDENTETSQLIELDLVEAKTCVATGRFDRAAACLRSAILLIDVLLLAAGRLHYRRGIRERYRSRIANLLFGLPKRGESDSILPVVAFLKSNSSSDWLALLDWRASLEKTPIPEELKTRFEDAIAGVAAAGAPFLYGFREKYDEPWSAFFSVDQKTFSSVGSPRRSHGLS